jgi:protein O-mannosyl-transferase
LRKLPAVFDICGANSNQTVHMAAKQKNTKPATKPAAAPAAKSKPAPAAAPAKTNTFQAGFWRTHWLPSLLCIAFAFGLYQASIHYGYILDDEMVIEKNGFVQQGWAGLGDIFAYDSFMGYFKKKEDLFKVEGGRYRPLSLATFAMEVGAFGPGKAWLAHFINILLYGLNGVLLYRILLGLFPIPANGRWYFSAAFIGAALFLFHPLHTECVANIKGRDEILALMGSLAALYATLKYFDTHSKLWYWASGLFLLLAMLAKENALTFVVIIPFTAWFFARVSSGRAIGASLPLLIAAFLFVIIRYKALGYMLSHGKPSTDLMNNSFLGMTAGERLATITLTLGWYIKLLFVPFPLTHDYYPYHVPKVNFSDWRVLLSLAFYVGLGIWSVRNLRSKPVVAYGFLFFVITLSIVSNLLVSVGSFMNERFAYMPSMGFCLVAGWFLARQLPAWVKEGADRPYILGVMLLLPVLAAFAWITVQRIPDWQNQLTLNTSAVRNSPGSARAHSFYATALFGEMKNITDKAQRAAMVDTMDAHVDRALRIYPEYSSAWVMRANVAYSRFEDDKQMDKMFNTWSQCFEKIPNTPIFRNNVDRVMKYLAQNGGNPNKINTFCYNIGYELFFKKRRDRASALQILEYTLLTQPDSRSLTALAEVYEATGNAAKAAEMRQRAAAY